MEKKKLLFIVNPQSGSKNKEFLIKLIDKEIDKEKFNYTLEKTAYAGHATQLAAQAVKEGTDMVIAVGGDGTVNEVGRALIHTSTSMGIIPCGSGNGLARHLHIPLDPAKAIATLNQYQTEWIDFGKINGHPFFCTCGVGFDAFISFKFASSKKRGPITYVENILKDILSYKPETYEVETEDGSLTYHAFLIACGNAAQYGNNAYIAPHASLKDGEMNVTIVEPFNILDVAPLAVQLFNKNIDKNSRIKTLCCKRIHIRRKEAGVAHYDGDPILMNKDIFVEIINQGISVLVGEEEKSEFSSLLQFIDNLLTSITPINAAFTESLLEQNKKLKEFNEEFKKRNKELFDKIKKG